MLEDWVVIWPEPKLSLFIKSIIVGVQTCFSFFGASCLPLIAGFSGFSYEEVSLWAMTDLTAVGSFKDSISWESVSKVIFIKLPKSQV